MSFFTDLPIINSAILSTLRKSEGCLGVEGWLKTGNKGHYFQAWFSLEVSAKFFSSFVDQKLGWGPFYQGCHHEETSDFGSESDPTLTRHCATFSSVTPIFYCISAVYMSQRTFVRNLRKIYLIFLPHPRYLKNCHRQKWFSQNERRADLQNFASDFFFLSQDLVKIFQSLLVFLPCFSTLKDHN